MISLKLFGIKTPAFRVLPRNTDDSDGPSEFQGFKRGVCALYSRQEFAPPTNINHLFDAPALVMSSFVVGVPLCHRSTGKQRHLLREDWLAMGRIFV